MNIRYIFGWRDMKKGDFISSINFLRKFIDQVEYGHVFSPYLHLAVGGSKYLWGYIWIIEDLQSYIEDKGLAKPIRYIVRKNNYLIIQEKELSFEDEIEEQYKIFLEKEEEYREESWDKPEFFNLFKKKYPKAFTLYDKKIKLSKELEDKYGIKIYEVIQPTGIAYSEIRFNIGGLSHKEIINKIFKAEEIYLELYSKLFGVNADEFKLDWRNYKDSKSSLYGLLGLLNEFIRFIPEESETKVMQLKNHRSSEKTLKLIIELPNHMNFNTYINYNRIKREYLTYFELVEISEELSKSLSETVEAFEKSGENALTAKVIYKQKRSIIDQFKRIIEIISKV